MKRNEMFLSLNARSVRGQSPRSFRSLLIGLAALIAYGMTARGAESLAAEGAASGWSFAISPYLWAAGVKGKSGTLPGLPPADVDESFGDIFGDLKFAGMLIATARKGNFGIGGDLQYVKTKSGIDAAPPIFGGGDLTSETFALSAWADYVVFEEGQSNLKVAAGARLWSIDTELKFSGEGLLSGRTIKHDETWVDPMLGAIGRADVAANVFVQGWGFVGGFGAGSDIMVDLFGGIGYRFSDSTSSTIGYRWLKIDYDNNGFLYDVRQQGIAAGMTFRF